jgi:hypothetical protein
MDMLGVATFLASSAAASTITSLPALLSLDLTLAGMNKESGS